MRRNIRYEGLLELLELILELSSPLLGSNKYNAHHATYISSYEFLTLVPEMRIKGCLLTFILCTWPFDTHSRP